MKVMVLYDSEYGNTAQIAQAIAEGLSKAPGTLEEVQLHKIDEIKPEELAGLDMLIVGSPTQRFRPTWATSNFLKSIPGDALNGVKVAAFDTRFTEEEMHSHGFILSTMFNIFGYAAQPISDRLEKKGGEPVMLPEGFYVGGIEGPLLEGELERAVEWGRQILEKR